MRDLLFALIESQGNGPSRTSQKCFLSSEILFPKTANGKERDESHGCVIVDGFNIIIIQKLNAQKNPSVDV